MEMSCPLAVATVRTPDAAAITDRLPDGSLRTLTFSELQRATGALAAELGRQGVQAGERVALLGRNCRELVVALGALWQRQAVPCLLHGRLPPEGLRRQFEQAGCSCLLNLSGVAVEDFPALTMPALDYDPGPVEVMKRWDLERDATIIFSSGSSGAPKAVLHSFGNHYYSALGANRNLFLQAGDCFGLALPLYHIGGLAIVFRCLFAGATVALLPDRRQLGVGGAAPAWPDPGLARELLDFGVTHLSLVPTQLKRLLDEEPGPELAAHLRGVVIGGAELSAPVLARARERALPLILSYGSSEMGSQITATRPGAVCGTTSQKLQGDPDPMDLGKPLRFREVRIAPDGEVLVRGKSLCRGYLEQGELCPAVDDEGWFHTGDLGELSGGGGLRVSGRQDNMFISGGENIQPEGIERRLLEFPGVLEAIVVPVADEEYGQRPVAFLRTPDGSLPPAKVLGSFVAQALPRYQVPVAWYPWPDDQPVGMKPQRPRFRERAAQLQEYP